MIAFSKWLSSHRHAKSPLAQERIRIAMNRIPSVLGREFIACQRTLEQKISDQGPSHQRVDPHLLGLAIHEMAHQTGRLRVFTSELTGSTEWYAYPAIAEEDALAKLPDVAELYAAVSRGNFRNLIGDALELVVLQNLVRLNNEQPRLTFLGSLATDEPRRQNGGYRKIEPPQTISNFTSRGYPDFIVVGFDAGPISLECKNLREWIYPNDARIQELLRKSLENHTTPLLVARRIHYTTIRNFLTPAGIISHESYFQYYPDDQLEIIERVKHKRSLGFSDVRPVLDAHPRTWKFLSHDLPLVADKMAARFKKNRPALEDFIAGDINLAQLYNAIESPAAGNWRDFVKDQDFPGF